MLVGRNVNLVGGIRCSGVMRERMMRAMADPCRNRQNSWIQTWIV